MELVAVPLVVREPQSQLLRRLEAAAADGDVAGGSHDGLARGLLLRDMDCRGGRRCKSPAARALRLACAAGAPCSRRRHSAPLPPVCCTCPCNPPLSWTGLRRLRVMCLWSPLLSEACGHVKACEDAGLQKKEKLIVFSPRTSGQIPHTHAAIRSQLPSVPSLL